ncbi:MAG: hypothetical protein JSV31_23540 [Desulfobacterales bacterium]|nr:MAG: hypothetical protein JSV31_23540 [Desulfobacterales bacterium]
MIYKFKFFEIIKQKGCFLGLGFFIFMTLFFLAEAPAYKATLAWVPNEEADFAGYKLYGRIGNPCPPYDLIDTYLENALANPLSPMVQVDGIENDKKYYFVVTAFDTSRNESDYSNIIYLINGLWGDAICSSGEGGGRGELEGEGDGGGGGG